MPKLSKKTLYWTGFIIIVIIYSAYNLYLVDVSYYGLIPRKLRHVAKFTAVLLIYATGTVGLRKYAVSWVVTIWHSLYIVVITLLLMIGVYDWWFGMISDQLRNVTGTLLELLICPLVYIAAGILTTKFGGIKISEPRK